MSNFKRLVVNGHCVLCGAPVLLRRGRAPADIVIDEHGPYARAHWMSCPKGEAFTREDKRPGGKSWLDIERGRA